jgi:hypothetical protein
MLARGYLHHDPASGQSPNFTNLLTEAMGLENTWVAFMPFTVQKAYQVRLKELPDFTPPVMAAYKKAFTTGKVLDEWVTDHLSCPVPGPY